MQRTARSLAIGLGALFVVVVVLAVGFVLRIQASVDRVDVQGLDGADAELSGSSERDSGRPTATGTQHTVLVLGSDTRAVLSADERRELGTGHAEGERMEVISFVRLDPAADEIRMLSVPRDTLITRCDGSRGRINAAYAIGEREGIGGMSCVVQTLTTWSGLSIDHVVKLDFRGFVDIVDALGGVPMHIGEPMVDDRANLDLSVGCTRLGGPEALAFVRARGLDDDFGRQERQRRLLEEMRREIAGAGMFDDPIRFVRTAEALARHVEIDGRLTLRRMRELALHHRESLRSPIDGRSLTGQIDSTGAASFLHIDEADAQAKFEWLTKGSQTASPVVDTHGGDGERHESADGPDDDVPGADAVTDEKAIGATVGRVCF